MSTVNTINIGNIHDKDGKKVAIKCEMISSLDIDDEIGNLGHKKFTISQLENLVYPTLKLHEQLFTQPFMSENQFYITHISTVLTPL